MYSVDFLPTAAKALAKLPKTNQERIAEAIDKLAEDPTPPGAIVLQGSKNPQSYRIRVGDYRILYQIENQKLIVLIIRIGHRREVYRIRR